jgi:sulfatase modifying factor 1
LCFALVVTCGGERKNEDGSSVGDGGDSVGRGGTGADGGRDDTGGSGDVGGTSAGSSAGGVAGGALGGSSPTGGVAGEGANGGAAGVAALGGASGTSGSGGASGAGASGAFGGNQPTGGVAGQGGVGGAAGAVGGTAGSAANGGASGAGASGGASGSGAQNRPSCAGMTGTECRGENCCTSIAVPTQRFTLGGTVVTPTSSATVNSFALDKYQVTVGRFRRFVSNYDAWRGAGNPAAGAGAHPLISGSGWQSSWNASLPATAQLLVSTSGIQCDATYQTWTASAGSNEQFPVNCINWFHAFAFCVWDGMRLATEAERECAGAGGSEGRLYPWGSAAPDSSRGIYANAPIVAVGSKPAGAGLWGHLDLAGPLFDWGMDVFAPYPTTCNNCAAVSSSSGGMRVLRGTGFNDSANFLRAASRNSTFTNNSHFTLGIRCARSP